LQFSGLSIAEAFTAIAEYAKVDSCCFIAFIVTTNKVVVLQQIFVDFVIRMSQMATDQLAAFKTRNKETWSNLKKKGSLKRKPKAPPPLSTHTYFTKISSIYFVERKFWCFFY